MSSEGGDLGSVGGYMYIQYVSSNEQTTFLISPARQPPRFPINHYGLQGHFRLLSFWCVASKPILAFCSLLFSTYCVFFFIFVAHVIWSFLVRLEISFCPKSGDKRFLLPFNCDHLQRQCSVMPARLFWAPVSALALKKLFSWNHLCNKLMGLETQYYLLTIAVVVTMLWLQVNEKDPRRIYGSRHSRELMPATRSNSIAFKIFFRHF